MLTLQAATVALALLEGVKWLLRKFVFKNDEFSFPAVYYTLMVPFLTAIAGIGLAEVGWADPIVYEWSSLLQWGVAVLFELMFYHMGVEPLKEHARS